MHLTFLLFLSLLLTSPVQAKDSQTPKPNWFYTRLGSDLETRYKKLLLNNEKISKKINTSLTQTDPYFIAFQSQFYDFTKHPTLFSYNKASSTLDSINRIQVDSLKKHLKAATKQSASRPKSSP